MIWLCACPGTFCIVLCCIVCGTVVHTHLTPKFNKCKNIWQLFPLQHSTLSRAVCMLLEAKDGFSSDTVTLSPQVSWKINCVLRERHCVHVCFSVDASALDLKSLFLCVWKPWAQMLRIPRTMCSHWLKVNAIQAVSEWATGRTAVSHLSGDGHIPEIVLTVLRRLLWLF